MNNKKYSELSCIEFAKDPVAEGLKWNDVTSYTRNGDGIPDSFAAEIGDSIIIITNNTFNYTKGKWSFSCKRLGFVTEYLGDENMSAKDAATIAFHICKRKAIETCKAFKAV